jgi:hypothetical protein
MGGLRRAIKFLMSRIERGMKVEVKALPPPAPEPVLVEEGGEAPPKDETAEAEIKRFEQLSTSQLKRRVDQVQASIDLYLVSLEAAYTRRLLCVDEQS